MKKNGIYNLEDRTYLIARECHFFIKVLPKILNDIKDEKLGNKDFLMSPKIARKEAKEAQYRLELLKDLNSSCQVKVEELIAEAVN